MAKPRTTATAAPTARDREVEGESATDALLVLMGGGESTPTSASEAPAPKTPAPDTESADAPAVEVIAGPATASDVGSRTGATEAPEPEASTLPLPIVTAGATAVVDAAAPAPTGRGDGDAVDSTGDPIDGTASVTVAADARSARLRRILKRDAPPVLAVGLVTVVLWIPSVVATPTGAPAAAPVAAAPSAAATAAERQPAGIAALAGARRHGLLAAAPLRAQAEHLGGFSDAAVLADVATVLATLDTGLDGVDPIALAAATSAVHDATPGLIERAIADADARLAEASDADAQTVAAAASAIDRLRAAAADDVQTTVDLFAPMRVAVEAAVASDAAADARAAAEAEAKAAEAAAAAARAAEEAAKAAEDADRRDRWTDGSEASAWNASSIYMAGDLVTYRGKAYEAQWWIRGTAPSPSEYGPWILVD
ncbi:carbohydrate-binding protein [Agromyces sp. LHK192]|uniref:carbohydrate-binding protein n=1 Tax=Agromyces sp. LHK192 TaxID=2498704 RepID=UPI000FDC904E|nr:carbohydrate-binding protein [Agromyces sp. LHK192]